MGESDFATRVAAVRRFNRFYTRQVGLLGEHLLESPFSLSEARVLYELAQSESWSAAGLGKELGLDAGYLSRILRGFAERGLLEKQPSESDGRRSLLVLTAAGREAFQPLDAASRQAIGALLKTLPEASQQRLVGAMGSIEDLLGSPPKGRAAYLLRPHRSGDMGWVIGRHGALYAEEYGFDLSFEALVASIAAEFLQKFDPARENCWIAERGGENVGSVFLVKYSEEVAKLRLLIVEPSARGLGIGERLVAECIRFSRQAGYGKLTLWTQSILLAARKLYERAGFTMVGAEPNRSFGRDLVSETWELKL